jgi:hypothetical protein
VAPSTSGNGGRIYAYIWFDVEDNMTPETNDPPLQAIRILKKYKVPVTYKLIAEKVRFLKEQKRQDVISAIDDYCDIGYHTDSHSRHPVVYEYINGMDVLRGSKEIEAREQRGLDELKSTFRRAPSCFGHAGSQWAPHYYPYLKRVGIPVYMDSTDVLNLDDSPYWYCGVLNLTNATKNMVRFDRTFETKDGNIKLKKRLRRIHDRLRRKGGGAISVLWHPHTAIDRVYWDIPNFANGKNTPKKKYVQPQQQPPEVKRRALEDFESLIKFGSSFKDIRFISATETRRIYRRKIEMDLGPTDIRKIAQRLVKSREISYSCLGSEYISPSQSFCALVNFVASFARTGVIPRNTKMNEPLGPMSRFESKLGKETKSALSDLLAAAEDVSRFISKKGYLPSSIRINGSVELAPSDFLATLCRLCLLLIRRKPFGNYVQLQQARMILEEKFIDARAFENACRWPILPQGFRAPEILEQAKLQTWTLVPAIPRP